MIINHCLEGLRKLGVKYVETGPMLENNNHILNLWKKFNPELAKRRRCWGMKVADYDKEKGVVIGNRPSVSADDKTENVKKDD